ncbi:hypothetical protein BP5796_02451 [Coleophoma crateriformis]|uniref:Plus3 domain-containing protein n=1 Tax=Coleophoma crateriformis TaxID=565419 RepID=A0A3D8SYB2_9HELO|nr:hypothetical protein BP5796_02451 [Coleophoma crateriformis]
MADIDDELLALAGDASSDEEETNDISRASSVTPDKSASAQKSGGRKKGRRNDSEDEGEISSANSDRSVPMDESDSDSDAEPELEDEGDKYPFEGKFLDAAEKATIMALPEIKREEILAERAQEVETDRQNRVLRQFINSRKADERKRDKKRKAGNAGLDEDDRKPARQRTKLGGGKVGESSSGIEKFKRAKAEKDDRNRRREEDRARNKGGRDTGLDDFSDHDVGAESDVEWDDGKSKAKKADSPDLRDSEPAGLQELQRVRVGRSQFAMVCFYPGFEEAITGTFVRINVGNDKGPCYRMAVVKGFTEDRPYAVLNANGKSITTTQYVRAAHGKSEKNWPFFSCSESPFTEAEWNRYKQTCLVEGVPLPKKGKVSQKIADINNLVNRSWTEEELQAKLTKSGALVNKYIPIERNRLNNAIKEAKSAGNEAKAAQLRAELEELEGPKLAYGTSMQPSPKKTASPAGLSQQERLAVLNKQNRQKNIQEVRQALINERKAAKMTEAALARGEVVTEDHSKRLKTRAKFKHDVSEGFGPKKTDSDRSGTNTPAAGTPNLTANKPSTPLPHLQRLQSNGGIPKLRRPVMDDDIIGSLDLGIDLEI